MPERLYSYDTLLERLGSDLEQVPYELPQLIEEENAMMCQRDLARQRHLHPPISPTSEMVWCGARNGREVTTAVRAPVRPATL